LHSLHIGEAIRHTNGHVDVVGYFPEGKGIGNDGDPFYAEQNIGSQTPAQYVAEAKEHWTLDVHAVPGQTLDQFVRRQAEAWNRFDHSKEPPRYETLPGKSCTIRMARWSAP